MTLASCFAFALSLLLANGQSLSGDVCKTSPDCAAGLQCYHVVNGVLSTCTASSFTLICHCRRSLALTNCIESADCPSGEMCSNDVENGASSGKCMSRSYGEWIASWNPNFVLNTPGTSPSPGDGAVQPLRDGYTAYPCTAVGDCVGSRTCYDSINRRSCTSGTLDLSCICLPSGLRLQDCNGGDCGEGESCSNEVNVDGRERRGHCVSKRVLELLAQRMGGVEIETVCIGVEHLEHVSREELVYDSHRLARVLCDGNRSCATPGHMVVFQGRPMMMKRYCDLARCTSRVMYVNSPRYRRGVTVASRTEGLVFTAFAARYSSTAEEKVLALAVRVGL